MTHDPTPETAEAALATSEAEASPTVKPAHSPTRPKHLNTQYAQELEIVNLFARRLQSALSGSEQPTLINRLPIDVCHLGVLSPWQDPDVTQATGADHETEDATDNTEAAGEGDTTTPGAAEAATPAATPARPSRDPHPSTDSSPDDSPSPAAVEVADDRSAARRPASALGCELMLRPERGRVALRVNLSFAFYTAHLPTYAEQRASLGGEYQAATPERLSAPEARAGRRGAPERAMNLAHTLRRQTLTLENLTFDLDATKSEDTVDRTRLQDELDRAIREALRDRPARKDTLATRAGAPLREEDLASEAAFEAALARSVPRGEEQTEPHLKASLTVRTEPQANGDVRVSLYLSNDTPVNTDQRTQNNVNILADAKLWGDVERGRVRPIEILPVPRDYQYDRKVWGVGHNTSVTVQRASGAFRTHALARFDQPRLTTKEELPTEFERFAEQPLESLSEIHEAMQAEAEKWRDEVIGTNTLKLTPEALAACEADFELFKGEVDRFAAGIAALKVQPHLLKAFVGMNRTMGRIAANKGFTRWRLFQIAYIVTQLPALALREGVTGGKDHLGQHHDWADELHIADVLWFPTGGGKTESYLGLVCCAVLYDRLRGKRMGLTAWLRFPLRMLSVQQLQRAVTMVYEAQVELNAMDPKPAGDPLLLGYFVGSNTTPNAPTREWFDQHSTPEALERYRMVADCPKCRGKGTVRLVAKPDRLRLYHQCGACQTYLPLVITDSEIYRKLPALMVGTVDKAATLGLQEKFGILWAGPKWKCPEHGYGNTDFCVYGCEKKPGERPAVVPYDPSPSLHIQDELHLLQEELGAFAGHYETLIRYCEAQVPDSHPAKVIAATATIEGFEHQARHLYGVKAARRFPSRGYQRHENFYARIDQEGGVDKTARVFLAFRPGGMSTDAASRCAKILGETASKLFTEEASALASLHETATPEDLAALRHYYAMTLTYVGSLTSGTRVNDALKEAGGTILDHTRAIATEYLSGRSTAGDIAGAIERIENPPEWTDEQHIDALVATNMISHGVDLERCNLMVMEKYPAETAEYIQASSRSGRKKVGLVVVVLPARNLRAASIYNRFAEYHRHLDRMVTPVPVNRFAKQAIRRTISGTVAGLIYGVAVPRNEGGKKRLRDLPGALAWLERDAMKFTRAHLRGAQALGQGNYDPDLEAAQAELIDETFDELHARMRQQLVTATSNRLGDALTPKPMTSLRDVERPVPFRPAESDHRKLDWFEQSK